MTTLELSKQFNRLHCNILKIVKRYLKKDPEFINHIKFIPYTVKDQKKVYYNYEIDKTAFIKITSHFNKPQDSQIKSKLYELSTITK